MVQPTHSSPGDHPTLGCRWSPASRCLLAKPKMGSVVMVIGDVLREHSLQMSLVQRDDMIEQLAAATSHPALGHAILPRALHRCLQTFYFHGSNRRRNFESILCVVVKDEELGGGLVREGFAHLLDNPGTGRIPCDIEVQDSSTVVADDEENLKDVEGERRDREEIHCRDGFAVITQERQPTFCGFWMPGCSPHPAGDGRFRYLEAEHEKFPVDARRTPCWILRDHLEDQLTDLLGDSPSSAHAFPHFAEHGPVQFESSLVPANNRFGQDEKERFLPIRPEAARYDPKESVECPQSWARGDCASTQRVVGGARGFPASGCDAHGKCESWLRTRVQRGQTWWQINSRSAFQLPSMLLIPQSHEIVTRHSLGSSSKSTTASVPPEKMRGLPAGRAWNAMHPSSQYRKHARGHL